MIASLRGTVQWIEDSRLVIDVNGVGYLVHVPVSENRPQPQLGESIQLYTHTHLRENELALYGCYSRQELEVFKTLITVPGIGPRTALAIVAVFSPETLRQAIAQGDVVALARVPGIGRKTAQRLVMDLNDKINVGNLQEFSLVNFQPNDDAMSALLALGYTALEARQALSQVPKETTALDERIVAALRYLGGPTH